MQSGQAFVPRAVSERYRHSTTTAHTATRASSFGTMHREMSVSAPPSQVHGLMSRATLVRRRATRYKGKQCYGSISLAAGVLWLASMQVLWARQTGMAPILFLGLMRDNMLYRQTTTHFSGS